MSSNPFLSVSCDKCKVPINSDTRYEYLCGHIICKLCDNGRCRYCGHPGPSNRHNNDISCSNDICEACEDTALYYCVTCPKLLCERCAHIHSVSGTRKDHQVVYLRDYPRQVPQDPPVNYDIPEHVYLPRKRASEGAEADNPSSRRRKEPLERSDTWDRAAEFRRPFRKSVPTKQFAYSKSASSKASTGSVQSIHEIMEKLSDRSYDNLSYRSEKSVGTDVSGTASMIKNNNFTIMVYSNSNNGSVSSGPPGKVRVIKNPEQLAEMEANLNRPDCDKCLPSKVPPENGECHEHGSYIARKASTLSSGSATSFSSHTCETHQSEFNSRSLHHSVCSKSDTMDNISDILNQSNYDPRRSVSPRPSTGTSPKPPGEPLPVVELSEDGYSEPADEIMVDSQDVTTVQSAVKPSAPADEGVKRPKEIHLLYDKDNKDFIVHNVRDSTPERKAPSPKIDDILDSYTKPYRKASSSSSHSSSHSNDSKRSPGERSLGRSGSTKSKDSRVDELLDKYNSPRSLEPDELQRSNVTITSETDQEPCMVPQKSITIEVARDPPSPLLERVRKQSLENKEDFLDEKLFDSEEEERFDGNDTYMTHSSHYSSEGGDENLSEIAEEPTLEACSATEIAEFKVESLAELHEVIEETSFIEEEEQASERKLTIKCAEDGSQEGSIQVFDNEDEEMVFEVESVPDDSDSGKDIMVTAEIVTTRNTIPDFLSDRSAKDEDAASVQSHASIRSTNSSKKRFGYAKSETSSRGKFSKTESFDSENSQRSRSTSPLKSPSSDSFTKIPIARSPSGEKLKKSLSKDSLTRSNSRDGLSRKLSKSSSKDSLTRSNSRDSLSRKLSKSSSKDSLTRSNSRDSLSRKLSKSSSKDSLSRIPRRKSSSSSSTGENKIPKSSSRESLTKLRRASSNSRDSTDKENERPVRSASRDSLSKIDSLVKQSLNMIPRSPSRDSVGGKSEKSSHSHNSISSGRSARRSPSPSKIPIAKSPSTDSLGRRKSDASPKSSRRSPSPSKIPIAKSPSTDSLGRRKSDASTKSSKSKSSDRPLKQASSPSKLPVSRSSSRGSLGGTSDASRTSKSSRSSNPALGKTARLASKSNDSMGSHSSGASTLSNDSKEHRSQQRALRFSSASSGVSSDGLRRHFDSRNASTPALPPADDNLPHNKKHSNSSSEEEEEEELPYAYEEIIGIDFTEGPPREIKEENKSRRLRNSSRNSDRSIKSTNSINSRHSTTSQHSKPTNSRAGDDDHVTDSFSECSGSFISDNSILRKQHPPVTYSDSEDSNNPLSSKRIMLDRIMSGAYRQSGEDLGFMDNLSDHSGSLTAVSSDAAVDRADEGSVSSLKDGKTESVSSAAWKAGSVEPIALTSVASTKCKHIVIGQDEADVAEPGENTLYFPTMDDYVQWSQNQMLSAKNLDGDSIGSNAFYDEIEFSDGENPHLQQEMLLRYADFKQQQSLASGSDCGKNKRLEDILCLDEMSLTSSRFGSDAGSNIMDVYSIETSSSTSTIVDDADEQHGLYSAPGGEPPEYFDKEERAASVASRDLPAYEEQVLDRATSEVSISSSLYSHASKDYIGHYADKFNDAMDPENQPETIEDSDRFNRKYSKRVSALQKADSRQTADRQQKADRNQSATLPRNRKHTGGSDEYVKQTYNTLPRKQTKEPGALTNFLNQTYGGRVAKPRSSDNMLLSRSQTFCTATDYNKFAGADYSRSLPRHLGRKPYLRCPSLRQVDWSVMGRKGTEPGFLMNPTGIAVDEDCVAICEEGNGRIQIFVEDESAHCINNLTNPCGIALSREHIYVSDIDTDVVKIYGRNALEKAVLGKSGSQRGMFNEPRGLAVNPGNGDLAVCDTENHRVQIFDVNCNFVKSIGGKGKRKGEFREPISCTYDRWGRLLVSDHCNYRVQIFDNTYNYIADFGKRGKSSGEFWGVNGLCSHSNGDILVVDSDNNCLSVHSSDGRFISVFGRRGGERWEFLYPHSVSTDEVGNVYVSDWGNHRIHIMDKKLLPYLELESHML